MTVTPASYNLTLYQGSDFEQQVTFLQTEGGSPVDLTSIGFRMQIRASKNNPSVIAELTTDNGKITKVDATGVITMSLSATETSLIKTGGVYDLEAYFSASSAERWLEGSVVFSQEVTRNE